MISYPAHIKIDVVSSVQSFPSITKEKTISIILPAFNEEHGLGKTIASIPKKILEEMGYEIQVLVVDNDSRDGTAVVARRNGADVIFEARRGYGSAYKTGIAHTRGDIIVTVDADGTYPVEDIPQLIGILEEEGLDFITTNRFAFMEDGAMSLCHKIGNFILTWVTRVLFGIPLKDSQSGMWVFRKQIIEHITLNSNSMSFSEEIKVKVCHFLKCRWKEIPIRYRARLGEVKLATWKHGISNLLYLVKLRFVR